MAYGKAGEKEIYASLPGTIREVEQMLKDWKGKKVYYFKNAEVTKENFLEYAPMVDVIYLATHAESDPYNRFRNRLVFHGKDGRNEYINFKDILGMDFRSQTIILSACNSGSTRYFRGTNISIMFYLNKNFTTIKSRPNLINDLFYDQNTNFYITYN